MLFTCYPYIALVLVCMELEHRSFGQSLEWLKFCHCRNTRESCSCPQTTHPKMFLVAFLRVATLALRANISSVYEFVVSCYNLSKEDLSIDY